MSFWRAPIPFKMKRAIRVAIVGAATLRLLYIWSVYSDSTGRFDREAMTLIVEEIRPLVKAGRTMEFQLDDWTNPKSLRVEDLWETYKRLNRWDGHIWAERSDEGVLKVTILTQNNWHVVNYGFAYSDTPFVVYREGVNKGEEQSFLDVPGLMYYADKKIDDHWWAVSGDD